MPVVHLAFDIDSDVYPELYAALGAIKHPVLREERLRQLAAMGLVWEAVRIQGPSVTQLPVSFGSAALAPASPVLSPAPPPKGSTRTAPKSPRKSAPAHVPVLVDVVTTSPAELAPAVHADAEEVPEPAEQPMPVTGTHRAPGSRTRLQRMKDRGLFRNG